MLSAAKISMRKMILLFVGSDCRFQYEIKWFIYVNWVNFSFMFVFFRFLCVVKYFVCFAFIILNNKYVFRGTTISWNLVFFMSSANLGSIQSWQVLSDFSCLCLREYFSFLWIELILSLANYRWLLRWIAIRLHFMKNIFPMNGVIIL